MRPFEVLLLAAELAGLAGLAFFERGRWTRYAAMLAAAMSLVQVAVEGARWQLYPAYVVAIALLVVVLLRARPSAGKGSRWKTLVRWGGLVLGCLATVLAAGLAWALPVFHFPAPTGPYAVGTLTYSWSDATRPDMFLPDPAARRQLVSQIFYPAQQGAAGPRAHYAPDGLVQPRSLTRLMNLPGFLLDQLSNVTTNAIIGASPAPDPHGFPVLLYLTGLGGYRQISSFQVEELVSHGYVVVALDQPGASSVVVLQDGTAAYGKGRGLFPLIDQSGMFPQNPPPTLHGRTFPAGIIPYLAEDVSAALNELVTTNQADPNGVLTGRLDLGRVGVFGISLGGIVAGQACHDEPRIKACLVMDAFMPADAVRDGLTQPAMWLTRRPDVMRLERERAGGWTEQDILEHQTTMHAVFDESRAQSYFVNIDGIFHVNFIDVSIWSPLLQAVGFIGPIDPVRAHRLIDDYTLAFFDRSLKGLPAPLLDGPSAEYPEVTLETHGGPP